jgi:hypothetical protein
MLPPEFLTPDLRHLFRAARAYLEGAANIQELNGAVAQAMATARLGGFSEQIVRCLESWQLVIHHRWNEWGTDEASLSESDFKAWLREHLLRDSASKP